jgi:hypothetical protein
MMRMIWHKFHGEKCGYMQWQLKSKKEFKRSTRLNGHGVAASILFQIEPLHDRYLLARQHQAGPLQIPHQTFAAAQIIVLRTGQIQIGFMWQFHDYSCSKDSLT